MGNPQSTFEMASQFCEICHNSPSKYNCSTCRTRRFENSLSCIHYSINPPCSCSLQCFKAHKSHCSKTTSGTYPNSPFPIDAIPAQIPRSEDIPIARLLMQDSRLEKLFEQHPNLRPRLKFIFEAATSDDRAKNSTGRSSGTHGLSDRGVKHHSSPERRIAYALRLLERDLNTTSESNGMKALAGLVAELSSSAPVDNEHSYGSSA